MQRIQHLIDALPPSRLLAHFLRPTTLARHLETHMRVRTGLAFVLVVLFGCCPWARASIVGTTGAIAVISSPPNVRLGFEESNSQIRAFAERQDETLASNLSVDISAPSTVPNGSSINLTPGTIPAGTHVESWLLHFDPVGSPQSAVALSGSITFSTQVLGIEVLTTSLDSTDSLFGAPGSEYEGSEPLKGLELAVGLVGINTFDGITLSADRKTITAILSTQMSLDEVRIFTAVPVPEPSTFVLLGAGALGLLALSRRGRRI